jgi:hypothetical protein
VILVWWFGEVTQDEATYYTILEEEEGRRVNSSLLLFIAVYRRLSPFIAVYFILFYFILFYRRGRRGRNLVVIYSVARKEDIKGDEQRGRCGG